MQKEADINQIFFPYAFQRHQEALDKKQRIVHYTSVETAMSIIRHNEVWMRNANCMNDFMEVQYGLDRLYHAYNWSSNRY
jgi:hypothetical protein